MFSKYYILVAVLIFSINFFFNRENAAFGAIFFNLELPFRTSLNQKSGRERHFKFFS